MSLQSGGMAFRLRCRQCMFDALPFPNMLINLIDLYVFSIHDLIQLPICINELDSPLIQDDSMRHFQAENTEEREIPRKNPIPTEILEITQVPNSKSIGEIALVFLHLRSIVFYFTTSVSDCFCLNSTKKT